MAKREDYDLEDLKSSKQAAKDGWVYANQRMDLLIISIGGAGIYVILEIVKYLLDNKLQCAFLLKITGVSFVLSIIINFMSQWAGQNANIFQYRCIDKKIKLGNNSVSEQENKMEKNYQLANKWKIHSQFKPRQYYIDVYKFNINYW